MISARGISSMDIDTQEAAWKLCKQELTQLRGRWTISTLIIAVVLFLLAFFARFHLYLEEKLLNLGTKQDILTAMQARKRRFRQSLLLFLIPALLSPLLYYFLVAVGSVKSLVDWQFFCIQAGTVLAGVLASHLLIKGREQLSIWDFEPPAADSSL
jgi:Na+/melibiose symporter-like transporter